MHHFNTHLKEGKGREGKGKESAAGWANGWTMIHFKK